MSSFYASEILPYLYLGSQADSEKDVKSMGFGLIIYVFDLILKFRPYIERRRRMPRTNN
jgi:hypothetical protein